MNIKLNVFSANKKKVHVRVTRTDLLDKAKEEKKKNAKALKEK